PQQLQDEITEINYNLANYGHIPYGKSLQGTLYLPETENNSSEQDYKACSLIKDNHRLAGAKLAIIFDDKEDEKIQQVILMDDHFNYAVKPNKDSQKENFQKPYENCLSNGRYCSAQKELSAIQSKQTIQEVLRQCIIYQKLSSQWWDYVIQFGNNCIDSDDINECSQKVMKQETLLMNHQFMNIFVPALQHYLSIVKTLMIIGLILKMNLLSLENFNENSHKQPILNSPRSLEACKRQGIRPQELIVKTQQEIKQLYKDKSLDKKSLELKQNHCEERRKEKIRILLEERAQIIEEEKMGLWEYDDQGQIRVRKLFNHTNLLNYIQYNKHSQSKIGNKYQSSIGASNSSVIEREKRQLEKIKLRQQKEIEQMLDHEVKMQQIRQQNEQKQQLERNKELEREHELMIKRKEVNKFINFCLIQKNKIQQEELKRQMEIEQRQKQEKLEQEQKQRQLLMYQKEQIKAQQEEERRKEREREYIQREEERKQKQLEFQQQIEEKLQQQYQIAEEKRMLMEQKEQIRLMSLQEKTKQQAIQAEAKRLQQLEKLKAAKQKNEQELYKIRENYELKQKQNEEKRHIQEIERQQQFEQAKKRQEQNAIQLKQILENATLKEEERRNEYLRKMTEAEQRKIQLEQEQEIERQKQIQLEHEKELQRQQVKSNNEKLMKEKVEQLEEKYREKEQNVQKVQYIKQAQLIDKTNIESIKRADRQENVQRIQR
ncbi:hypothetical protein IMG5_159320, partial [Ichthyophthirius multifiliis]